MKHKLLAAAKSNLTTVILAILGAVGGYLYYRFVGCVSGTCVITSSLYLSVLYGGIMGGLIGSLFTKDSCRACGTKPYRKDDSCE